MEAAADKEHYHLAVIEMLTNVRDSHSFAFSKVLDEHFGAASTAVRVRWIEGAPVVTAVGKATDDSKADIQPGDVIVSVDGEDASTRVQRLVRYMPASTPQSLCRRVCARLLDGSEGSPATVVVRKPSGQSTEVKLVCHASFNSDPQRTGDILRVLPGGIGYADLDRLPVAMVDEMFQKFKDAPAIIFDMRGYPQGTAWSIAPRLTEQKGPTAARFSQPLVLEPIGAVDEVSSSTYTFLQSIPQTTQPRYKGKTVMLIDDRTISQAEHTGLFFEAANGTKFVGSPTTGANGDVTQFMVPGGIRIWMTGHDVRHADGRQLQRVGLQPDVPAAPTIDGIRPGRDEVLERALEYLGQKGPFQLGGVGEAR